MHSSGLQRQESQETAIADNDTFKVVLVGDTGVGKTSMMNRYMHNQFDQFKQTTISPSFITKVVQISKANTLVDTSSKTNNIKLQIWDTAGNEKFRSLSKMYYQNADWVIFCYDITMKSSFEELESWKQEIEENLDSKYWKMVICGCKSDLTEQREVNLKDALIFAKECGFKLFETSSKLDKGIDFLFLEVAKMMLKMRRRPRQDSIRLSSEESSFNKRQNLIQRIFRCC